MSTAEFYAKQLAQADADWHSRLARETRPEADKVAALLRAALRRLGRMKPGPDQANLLTWARHELGTMGGV